MPNAQVLTEKQAIVAALTERLQNATSGVFVDYKGINVADDTKLRAELREAGVEYTVVKNTLTRFAAKNVGLEELDPVLNGTTSLATTTGDPIAPIRIVSEFAKKMNGKFEVKAGFMEGKILPLDQLAQIAELPGKDALYAKVLGTMLAPPRFFHTISALVCTRHRWISRRIRFYCRPALVYNPEELSPYSTIRTLLYNLFYSSINTCQHESG